jgi:hypothetical protein
MISSIGAGSVPTASWVFSRNYVNGAGTATGVGGTSDHGVLIFGRAGWVFCVSPRDEFAASAGLSRSWQMVAAYTEASGPGRADVSQAHCSA